MGRRHLSRLAATESGLVCIPSTVCCSHRSILGISRARTPNTSGSSGLARKSRKFSARSPGYLPRATKRTASIAHFLHHRNIADIQRARTLGTPDPPERGHRSRRSFARCREASRNWSWPGYPAAVPAPGSAPSSSGWKSPPKSTRRRLSERMARVISDQTCRYPSAADPGLPSRFLGSGTNSP